MVCSCGKIWKLKLANLHELEFFSSRLYWIALAVLVAASVYCIKDIARIQFPHLRSKSSYGFIEIADKHGISRTSMPAAILYHAVDLEWKILQAENERLLQIINSTSHAVFVSITDLDATEKTVLARKVLPLVRSIHKVFHCLWYFISGAAVGYWSDAESNVFTPYQIKILITDGAAVYQFAKTQLKTLMDIFSNWRNQQSAAAARSFQNRMWEIQNPIDCNQSKFLVCDLSRSCGLGCQLHYGMFCVAGAYALNRTLILQQTNWQYTNRKWEDFFVPASPKCQWTAVFGEKIVAHGGNSQKNKQFLVHPDLYARPFWIPNKVPSELVDQFRLADFHEKPHIWWIGQLMNYLFRFYPDMEHQLKKRMNKSGFKSPIVGIHVRRSDKIREAKVYPLDRYMQYVDAYYNKLEITQNVDQRRVFLASDHPGIFGEFRIKYPQYHLVSNQAAASLSSRQNTRYTEDSLMGIISDLYYLSQTDHLVCTMSSNVCRVAYALLQTRFPDASKYYDSLDLDYLLFGEQEHSHLVRFNHTGTTRQKDLLLHAGDRIIIETNFRNGTSWGRYGPSSWRGAFPSYKVVDELVQTF